MVMTWKDFLHNAVVFAKQLIVQFMAACDVRVTDTCVDSLEENPKRNGQVQKRTWQRKAPAYPQRWTWSAVQDQQDQPEAKASSSVARRKAPAVLIWRAVPEEPHSTILDTAFLFVFNVSLLLLHGIQDYFGLDYIAKHKVHRLKSVNNFMQHGMPKRIYQQMVDLCGPFSMHYSWNEWANGFVVHRVMQTELDYLCDSKSLSCSHMRSCNLDVETRAMIVEAAMRSWPAYRFEAMTELGEKLQGPSAQANLVTSLLQFQLEGFAPQMFVS